MGGDLARNVEKHIRHLTESIGVRLAGSHGERAAADYTAEQLRAAGAEASVEEFPVNERHVTEERLELRRGPRWMRFPCSLLSNVPGTNGQMVEAPLLFFDSHTEYDREDLSLLTGKAVVHLGTHIETVEHYRRLVEAKPAFVMLVDTRFPADVPTADGMFPAYTKAYGAVPMVSVAYLHAWRWKAEGFEGARLRVQGGMRPSTSENVIGVLPGLEGAGSRPSEPGRDPMRRDLVFVGGHHDTQADSVGADDNAVGVAAAIELARLLAPLPRRRTVRLISFGAEEQLSVGSAEYVRRHREEIEGRGLFAFNFDAVGSLLGWSKLTCNGPTEMAVYLRDCFRKRGVYVKTSHAVIPYADHFPFVAAGVASAWLGRSNCETGRFFHHRPDDTIERIDMDITAAQIQAAADALAPLIQESEPPFGVQIPDAQRREARRVWESLFGGWQGLG